MFNLLGKLSPVTITILVICAALFVHFVLCADGACADLGKNLPRTLLDLE